MFEGFDDHVMAWKRFSFEQTISIVGKPQKKLNLIHKVTPLDELITYLKLSFNVLCIITLLLIGRTCDLGYV
jgi:hypothetical protein